MDRWIGKVAVVTGASSGIGEGIARHLVGDGMIVVGLARRIDKLESIKESLAGQKGTFHAHQCDITHENNVVAAFEWIKETLGGVHVLVNNAGILSSGGIIDVDSSHLIEAFEVNVFGLLYCTRQAVRIMKEDQFEGTIININSINGHKVIFFSDCKSNAYIGTKHAVTAISETLQHELRDAKLRIRVTSLSPGAVKSEMFDQSNLSEVMPDSPQLHPEDIASGINYVLSMPQHVQITELTIRPLGEPY